MLCYEFPPIGGGGAKVVYGLTQQLSKAGYQVDLVTMGFGKLPAYERINDVNIYRVKCVRLRKNICTFPEMITYIISAIPLLLSLIKRNDYVLNHTHFIFPDGILAYFLKIVKGIPFVLTAHGSDVPQYNPDRFKLLHKILLPLWKKITSDSERVILPSKNLESMVRKINPRLKTTIIPNGIRLDKFSSNVMKEKQILIVTRMFERKGVQYFLEAVKNLELDYAVNIVGDGPYLNTLKSIAQANKLKINFLGYIDNVSDQLKRLYEESEIFVFTSESENFPIVLLEAMLSGMAIITTNDNGCSEVVGDTAILIDSKNSDSIRKSLTRLIDNPQNIKPLQLAARQRVEDHFSWECIAEKHLKLYAEAASSTNLSRYPKVYIKSSKI